MAIVKCVSTFPHINGLAKDAVTNSIYVGTAGDVEPTLSLELALVYTALRDFYNENQPSSGVSLINFMGAATNVLSATLRFYNLADPEPRVPVGGIFDYDFTSNKGPDNLPGEVALCLSYQAASASGSPQARRRGRMFLGRFDVLSVAAASGRPAGDLMLTMREAARGFLVASDAAASWGWVVIAGLDTGQGPPTAPVVNGWVDNEWDTQRRRGIAADVRAVFDLTQP